MIVKSKLRVFILIELITIILLGIYNINVANATTITDDSSINQAATEISLNPLTISDNTDSIIIEYFDELESTSQIDDSIDQFEITDYETVDYTEDIVEMPNLYNLYLSDNDMFMMCIVVSDETGYCEDMAQKAVAHTIINRLVSDEFPNDMYSMITQPNQYDAIHPYFDGQYRPGLEPGTDAWYHTMDLCYEALDEYDFTNGAYAYYNPDICGYDDWFESLILTYVDQYGRFFTW